MTEEFDETFYAPPPKTVVLENFTATGITDIHDDYENANGNYFQLVPVYGLHIEESHQKPIEECHEERNIYNEEQMNETRSAQACDDEDNQNNEDLMEIFLNKDLYTEASQRTRKKAAQV